MCPFFCTSLKSQPHHIIDGFHASSAKYLSSSWHNTVWEIIKAHMKHFLILTFKMHQKYVDTWDTVMLIVIVDHLWCINILLLIKCN